MLKAQNVHTILIGISDLIYDDEILKEIVTNSTSCN
jgi:hypothetical protein